jgi:hypothetical protein
MPTVDLTRRARRQLGPRRNVLLIVAPLVLGAVVLAVMTRGNGAADGGGLGPTVVAEPRDLATTLEVSGTLQRSDEQTVAHAAALPSDGGDAPSDGQGDDTGGGDMDGGGVQPASFVTEPSATGSSSTSSTSSTTPTTRPCSPTSASTTTPASSTTPTTPRRSDGDRGAGSSPGAATPTDGGGRAAPGDPAGGSGGDGGGGGEGPSAVLTGMLDVGATAGRGTVLYTANEEPVVAMIGDLPAWRTLERGVDDGADVRQLEQNLAALGYGDDLDVDESFTAHTAAAVEVWETDLGRATPDGVVTLGEVVFLTEPGDVLGHDASVGDTLDSGSPVMTIGSEQRTVVADVDATSAGGWAPGSTVDLEWADGTTSQGTVVGTGRDVTDGEVELTVAIGGDDADADQRRSGAEATVSLVDARRDGVLAVPVAAIVDDAGSPAVRVAQPDGPDRIVPVQIGLVADGWIEITAGLDGGEEIRLPG